MNEGGKRGNAEYSKEALAVVKLRGGGGLSQSGGNKMGSSRGIFWGG